MRTSSQASRLLSTASLMVVSRALAGESKPSRWRFLVKNSLMEISRWLAAMVWAVLGVFCFLGAAMDGHLPWSIASGGRGRGRFGTLIGRRAGVNPARGAARDV